MIWSSIFFLLGAPSLQFTLRSCHPITRAPHASPSSPTAWKSARPWGSALSCSICRWYHNVSFCFYQTICSYWLQPSILETYPINFSFNGVCVWFSWTCISLSSPGHRQRKRPNRLPHYERRFSDALQPFRNVGLVCFISTKPARPLSNFTSRQSTVGELEEFIGGKLVCLLCITSPLMHIGLYKVW